mmetsp:Transcript_32819/g.69902  ORF Transcript_32819/g.69902 Transcript_32819/m.69902 type:complete len:352 (-) Transcript_32819:101-1156(-)
MPNLVQEKQKYHSPDRLIAGSHRLYIRDKTIRQGTLVVLSPNNPTNATSSSRPIMSNGLVVDSLPVHQIDKIDKASISDSGVGGIGSIAENRGQSLIKNWLHCGHDADRARPEARSLIPAARVGDAREIERAERAISWYKKTLAIHITWEGKCAVSSSGRSVPVVDAESRPDLGGTRNVVVVGGAYGPPARAAGEVGGGVVQAARARDAPLGLGLGGAPLRRLRGLGRDDVDGLARLGALGGLGALARLGRGVAGLARLGRGRVAVIAGLASLGGGAGAVSFGLGALRGLGGLARLRRGVGGEQLGALEPPGPRHGEQLLGLVGLGIAPQVPSPQGLVLVDVIVLALLPVR